MSESGFIAIIPLPTQKRKVLLNRSYGEVKAYRTETVAHRLAV